MGFGFFFFFFLESVGLLYHLLGLLYHLLFFSLGWVCFTICCLGLMLGFFSLCGLALLQFFFPSNFSSKFFFLAFFFLLESRKNNPPKFNFIGIKK